MDFPLTCLRGLRSSSCFNGTSVTAKAFMPDISTAEKREDRCSETSVNFEDDHHAVVITHADTQNAKYGVARLPLSAIDHASIVLGEQRVVLNYERRKKPENQYHGNVLFAHGLTKNEIHALATVLAVRSRLLF